MKIYKVMASMLVLAGCAGHHEDDEAVTTQCEALINAPLDTTNTSAVGLCIGLATGPGGERTCPIGCSATLIARNLVLTARHCVQGIVGPGVLFQGSFSAPLASPEV